MPRLREPHAPDSASLSPGYNDDASLPRGDTDTS